MSGFNIDLTPLWTSISTFMPVALNIIGPVAAIGIGFALATWIVGVVRKQFGGGAGK